MTIMIVSGRKLYDPPRTALLAEDFAAWLKRQRIAVSPKSRLSEKLAYIANHWKGLQVFLTHGRVEMESSDLEIAIRPLAPAPRAQITGTNRNES